MKRKRSVDEIAVRRKEKKLKRYREALKEATECFEDLKYWNVQDCREGDSVSFYMYQKYLNLWNGKIGERVRRMDFYLNSEPYMKYYPSELPTFDSVFIEDVPYGCQGCGKGYREKIHSYVCSNCWTRKHKQRTDAKRWMRMFHRIALPKEILCLIWKFFVGIGGR